MNRDPFHVNFSHLFSMPELRQSKLNFADFKVVLGILTRTSGGCSRNQILLQAIRWRDLTLTKFIVEAGAIHDLEIATRCYDCDTIGILSDSVLPLQMAISTCDLQIVKYLLEAGANKYTENTAGQTAIDVVDACLCAQLSSSPGADETLAGYTKIAEFIKAYECVPTKGVYE